jgi:hypothetical protein
MTTGLGVVINALSGNKESAELFSAAIGKKIAALSLDKGQKRDDEDTVCLSFTMDDGSRFKLMDDGQSCCERRWMSTDDDLAYYIGATLLGAEVREGNGTGGKDVHDTEFLIVHTDLGDFTMTSHNEHNGYYGGFSIRCMPL